MLELSGDCFNEVCGDTAVRDQLATLEDRRQAAVRGFGFIAAAALVAAAAAFFLLQRSQWARFDWLAAMLCVLLGIIPATKILSSVSEALKRPVLAAIATRAGMTYTETGFTPFAYSEARNALFGHWLSQESFTDLFYAKDDEGRGFALYEAELIRSSGKNRHTVFRGQIYAVERRVPAGGTIAMVPDRGLFNFFKPAAGMARVRIESDPDFERRFEVYATSEMEARQLLFDSAFRARLVALAAKGHVFVFVSPDSALVAASGPNRFEAGSMLRGPGGEERVRSMLNDVCASVDLLREFRAKLG